MTNSPKAPALCAAFCAALCAASAPIEARAAPAGWTSGGRAAGLAGDGGETIGFSCAGTAPGTLRLVFAGFDAGLLQEGLDYTVVVTVDGTAYRQTTRAAGGRPGRRDLARVASAGELEPLIAALGAGARAEIASPAGREPVSLKGSGKALKALRAGCL